MIMQLIRPENFEALKLKWEALVAQISSHKLLCPVTEFFLLKLGEIFVPQMA